MKKKIILILIGFVTLIYFGCSKNNSAPKPDVINAESDFTVILTDDGQGVLIKYYIGTSEKSIIPATIQGMPVREIQDDAFGNAVGASVLVYKNLKITKIVIPEGVVKVGLVSNENLISVTLPSTLKSISGFNGCKALTSVNLPESLTEMDNEFFRNCEALTSIELPAGLKKIGNAAFSGSGLTSFPSSWPKGITVIPENAFSATKITGDLVIPEGVTTILTEAFYGCKNITSLTLPSTIREIGGGAFSKCTSLTTVNIPDSVKKIDFVTRKYIYGMDPMIIDEDADSVFNGCSNLDLKSQAALKKIQGEKKKKLSLPDGWF